VASIRQNVELSRLPDFRNLGVMLRILLAVNLFALLAALARSPDLARMAEEFVGQAAVLEPALIFSLLLAYLAGPRLARLPYFHGAALMSLIAVAGVLVIYSFFAPLLGADTTLPALARQALWTLLAVAALLYYFHLRSRAISPALAEARLMALTARIRPHFLFNSLNAVLGVIRSDPQRAERALEELSDLFRVLMADNRELVRLSDEIALCRQYLDLERLRLGDRLEVKWQVEACPPDALVPPLMLQPLLENAVYHGIEPGEGPGRLAITIARNRDEVLIRLENPYHGGGNHHPGNRMALDNIRERLMLFYDLEARLGTGVVQGTYRVDIRIPYRRK
jgi:two-component system sensor histidine kinase AlgZ